MIVTVSDESDYLLNVTKYMILSLSKHMPEEKLFVTIVNGIGKYDNEIATWHPNLFIKHYTFKDNAKKGSYFTYMALPLYDLLTEYSEPLIYIDGDTIINGSLSKLFDDLSNFDIMVRYRPYLDFTGPMGSQYGARTNTGVVALSNNQIVKDFVKDYKNEITAFIYTNKNPIAWNKEKTVLTGIDQELLWLLLHKYKEVIHFFPLNDKYNDSYFKSDSTIWHAKGICRTYPEYLIATYRYGRKDINVIKQYLKVYFNKVKKFIKSFLTEPKEESFQIRELGDILKEVDVKSIIIVNSNFYLDNENVWQNHHITCYDADPVIYYKNKDILELKNIEHEYIVYDTQSINTNNVDLLIHERKNVQIISNINYKMKIVKD